MADKTIYDYNAAVSIDATTHWLLIQPGNNSVDYNRINRNTLLEITGTPVGTTDVQNITNKTLDNTNTVTLKDTLFTLQDDSDTTKQARFQLSGITTATTRTYTLPNASSTLADISTAQTFTNKTLTSPTITGGTITNSTISVDSIAEYTAANGVTVDGLNIKDGKLNTANSVVGTNVTAGIITPEKLVTGTGTSWVWSSWTPVWTNFTLSGSTVTSRYTQVGKTVIARINIVIAGGNAPSGSVQFSLPVTSVAYAGSSNLSPLGSVVYYDTSGSRAYVGQSLLVNTTTASIYINTADATYAYLSAYNASVPVAAGNGDELDVLIMYEAA